MGRRKGECDSGRVGEWTSGRVGELYNGILRSWGCESGIEGEREIRRVRE